VLGGEMLPSSGTVAISGEEVEFRDPRAARARGIAVIHQELALAPERSSGSAGSSDPGAPRSLA
jgi:ribose transport system ATP-binding protein